MSGVLQAVFQNQRSFGPPAIGAAFKGGFFAGQISTAGNGIADYNLVVGPVASAESTSKQWKIVNTATSGTSSDIDGPANSAAMNNITHPAAEFCEGLTIGGFSDWYMPAKNELELCYYNLKPTSGGNSTGSGINPNAVPARASNYTVGDPAQTTASAFQNPNSQYYESANYWASTEGSASNGWAQFFGQGAQANYNPKNSYFRVRAVRRVAV